MTVQTAEHTHTPTLAEIVADHAPRADRHADPDLLAEVVDLAQHRATAPRPTAPVPAPRRERTLAERVDREVFDRAREEIAARTSYCRACGDSYVPDTAWSEATTRQRESWTELAARRQGVDGLCTHCETTARATIESTIDGYRTDIFAAIRTDSTARAVAPASKFDISGGTQTASTIASGRDTYEHLIEEDPRAAAEAAYDDVFSGLAVAPGRWSRDGICGQAETEGINYFASPSQVGPAKARCLSCPVLAQCLDYALRTPDGAAIGVWGGLSLKERDAIRSAARHDAYAAIGLEVAAFGKPVPIAALA